MYYIPRLRDGRLAPLPWQAYLYYFNGNWPLKNEATERDHLINKSLLIFGFVSIIGTLEPEFLFMLRNRHDLGLVLETLATSVVAYELLFRIYDMAYNCEHYKKMLTKFFNEIYIECTTENKLFYEELQRKIRPTRICSYTYLLTLFTLYVPSLLALFKKQQIFPYRMAFHYDYHPWLIFVTHLFAGFWGGFIVTNQLVAESNMIALLAVHLNGRYILLQRDLSELYEKSKAESKETSSKSNMDIFRCGLVNIIKQNRKLNQFAQEMQKQHSFRIFIMMSFSALLLCILGFKAVTVGMNAQILTYIIWICTKIVELIIFGELGSTIIETTDRLSTAYYLCNWEQIIQNSENARKNMEIMKLVTIAIEINHNPINFNGLGFFEVSLITVISIFKGAWSCFACLYAFY